MPRRGLIVGGAVVLGAGVWWFFFRDIHTIKDIPVDEPDVPPTSNTKTRWKGVNAILDKLRAAASAAGIPLGLLVGWVARESGGRLNDTTWLNERGYFQLMPDESKSIGVEHNRLSTDSDYSIQAGIKLIEHYMPRVAAEGVASSGSSYFWRLVKLAHTMGVGQMQKVVRAAKAAGQAGSWNSLEDFALGMHILGPQPKKWFPLVDQLYDIGRPFGFGSESSSSVGWDELFAEVLGGLPDDPPESGFDCLGAEVC